MKYTYSECTPKTCSAAELEAGDVFVTSLFSPTVWMVASSTEEYIRVTRNGERLCVRLDTGHISAMAPQSMIYPVKLVEGKFSLET